MEDKKKKKEDKKKRETSQKVPEQKIKVPESAKTSCSQPLTTPGSVPPSPGPVAPSSPSPGAAGVSAQVPPGGGNNAKQRTAVANGQPSSSPSGSQTSQQQRYMSREVPPRFRCQQDHKVLLKRGQPPLSSMLLGGGGGGAGGAGGGSGWGANPSLSTQGADSPTANTAGGADSNLGSSSASPPNSSSSSLCVAALSSSTTTTTTTTSTYANSTWGAGSGSQSSSQGCGKVIVDGTDLGDWPSILGGAKLSSDWAGGGGGVQEQDSPGNNNSSASWSERNIQQKEGAVGGGAGNMDNPSSPRSSPLSSSSSLNECVQSSGGVWGSSTSSQVEAGLGSAAFYNSKVSHLLPGPQESPVGSSSSVPGANFNPNVNPSAWPALVQPGTSTSASDSLPLHSSITSASSFSASTTLITTHSLSSVNQTGLHQQHTETAVGARSGEQQQHFGNLAPELASGGGARGAGPNQEGSDERGCGLASVDGEGSGNLSGSSSSSSAASSSWRAMPPVSSDLCAGVSQADGWGGGGTGAQGQEGSAWGFGSQDDKAGWGRGNDGSSNTPVVSQGAWEGGSSEAEWGGTAGGVSSSNLAIGIGRGGDGSSNSSSSGGSVGIGGSSLQGTASPKFDAMTKAWDNQKGIESGDGAVGEWGGGGGQGGGTAGGAPSSSSGGGSIAESAGGGSDSGYNQEQASSVNKRSDQTSNAEVAFLSMLNRSDLDPRVLSNTGWGQTQIRQNVAWDLDTTTGVRRRVERSTSSSSTFSSATMNTTTSRGPGYPSNTSSITNDASVGSHATSLNSGPVTVRDGWDGGATQSSCGPHMLGSTIRKPGTPEEDIEGNQGKTAGGWGDLPPENQGKVWGTEGKKWGDHRGGGGGGGGNWGDFGEQGSGWADGPDDKGTGGWKGSGRGESGGWGGHGGGDRGQRESTPGGGCGDGRSRGGSNSDDKGSSWGHLDEGGSQRGGWGGGDAGGGKSHQDWGNSKPHTAGQIPNSQVAPMKAPNQQQHQSQGQQPQGSIQGGWNSRSNIGGGGPPSKNQNQSSGWTSGPIPQVSGGVGDSLEPSGWEEPSPQSISRKMEIDDGTSAWGDPTRHKSKNVNLWDKKSASPGQSHGQQAPPPSIQQPPRRQQGMQHSRDTNPGNAAVGMWGGGAQSADNGAATWGQSSDAATGWGDPDESGKSPGWGNPSSNPGKSGTKSMESWVGKGEGPVAASRHSSWDEEDDGGGGVWNSAGSQGNSSSFNSGGWGQTHGGKRGNIKSGGGDSWMNPVSRQFSNMGLLGDDPSLDKKMEGDKRGITDYNGEMRRGGRGGGGYRMPSSKDMTVDMGPYGEKMGGHGVFVGSGGGMPQPRGMHQPGMHPMNPSQALRAQVPHQFLSAQVPGPMLKQMPSPGGSVGGVVGGVGGVSGVGSVGGVGGVGGGVFPPHQISPQQLAMLSNIYPHMQQFHLACQLLLQQQQQQQQQQLLQNQRKFPQPQPLRQQPDPQQLARIMAILQQQRQHQQGGVGAAAGGGSSKLSPSHLGGGLSKQPMVDPIPHPGMGGALSDLHAKTQGIYSGLAPGGNLSGLELSPMMGGMKDTGGQQSRFKWMMEGHSPAPSPPDTTLHKNGPLPSAIKVRGGSPYSQYEMLGSDGLGIPSQGSAENWHRTPGSKMGNKPATSSWPPEFQPGVPWKGIQSSGDPESDPYMTPGSVLGSPGPPSLNDSDHQLLRDNIGPNPSLNTSLPSPGAWPYSASDSPLSNAHSTGKYSEYKPSWPPEPIGQNKLWKTNRNSSQLPRPPPGLTNQKQASPSPWGSGGPRLARSWGGGGINQESRFGPAWSEGVASRGSCWLLLSNLTPQIDGSTLRTICMQHGPLLTFHLGLTQGSALIRYSSRQEAAKAQGALHMCVLGNTTILAEFVSEEEVARYFAHSQAGGAEGASSGGSAAGGTQGSSGTGTAIASSGGSSPGNERAAAGTTSGGNGNGGGGGESGAAVLGSVRSSGSAWQSLDGTGSSSETSSAQGPGLGIFSQWSTNGAGEGGGVGGVDSGRSGLWGGMTAGYSSSSLWGAPQMEERHQMDSPAALLPGDLLGGGADSI